MTGLTHYCPECGCVCLKPFCSPECEFEHSVKIDCQWPGEVDTCIKSLSACIASSSKMPSRDKMDEIDKVIRKLIRVRNRMEPGALTWIRWKPGVGKVDEDG